jgi:di/tricarboxylate transporter
VIALVLVAIVILVTEFASNVASASGTMPVVGGLALATGADPYLLAMPAAMAASWASCCRPAPGRTPSPGRPAMSRCREC